MQWNFTAAIAAWVVPGLGHLVLGHAKRGVILGITIIGLWLGGLAIGGISVFDRHHHPFWFLGQMLTAPSLVAEAAHRQLLHRHGEPMPGQSPIYQRSLGRAHEQGLLYTALAGMLNLLAVLDVLHRDRDDPRDRRTQTPQPAPAGARGRGGGDA